MGVISRRIALGVLMLASILLPLRRAHYTPALPPVDNRSERLLSLVTREHTAKYLWSALDVRDMALHAIQADLPLSQTPPFIMVGFPGVTGDSEAEALIARLWKKIGPTDSAVRSAIVAYNDAPYHQSAYTGTLFAQRDGKSWCVAIAPASARPAGGARVRKYSFDDAIAPCTFLAAFGLPGKGVRAWLAARQYALLRSDYWLTRPRGVGDRAGPWTPLNESSIDDVPEMPLLLRALGSLDFTSLLMPPYSFGAPGLRCIGGDEAACTREVLYSPTTVAGDEPFPSDLTVPYWMARREPVTVGTPRPPNPSLVSAMVSDHDRARFSRFWKSDRPVEEAFQEAFGESLGAWTARWAASEWESSYWRRFRGAEFLLGVTLDPSWPFLVIAWSGVAVLIAARVATRRTT
jgi:hypothetical protein